MSTCSNSPLKGQWTTRRSQRLYIQIPLTVEGHLEDKTPFAEQTQSYRVSAHGALIRLHAVLYPGQKLVLRNSSNETQEGLVVFIIAVKDGTFDVGVELTKPNPSFWGVSFPPEDWSTSHPDAKEQLLK